MYFGNSFLQYDPWDDPFASYPNYVNISEADLDALKRAASSSVKTAPSVGGASVRSSVKRSTPRGGFTNFTQNLAPNTATHPNLSANDVLIHNLKKDPKGATSTSKLGSVFDKAKGIGSDVISDIAFTADNFFNPSAGGVISYGFNPWSKAGKVNIPKGKTGLNIGGLNVGKWSNIANTVMQGIDAVGGLSEMSDLNKDAESLESNIIASAAGNPLLSSYLTSDQLSLLGKLRRGTYDSSAGLGGITSNVGNLFSGAASGAMSGALGGLPGMLIGGIGGLINSGIDNINAETSSNTAQLEALYQSLLDAEQQYKSMKRPNFSGLGIQQRYQNMYA